MLIVEIARRSGGRHRCCLDGDHSENPTSATHMQRCVELPWSSVAGLARSVARRSHRTATLRNDAETAGQFFARSIRHRSCHADRSNADTALFESPRNLLRAKGTIIRKVDNGTEHGSVIEAVEAIRKSSICKEYRLQPRDVSLPSPTLSSLLRRAIDAVYLRILAS